MKTRRGIVLLEVLMAAVILAVAALALVEMQDAALRRSDRSGQEAAAARAAARLAEEVALRPELTAGSDSGRLQSPPGASWKRTVELHGEGDRARLVRVTVEVEAARGGSDEALRLERWFYTSRAVASNR